ncbi:hypothetical protein H5410_046770 [Solanum commersonii]|uniref:Reverse transcriptase zinc-binding domain-containing protein n=1 Tax=Solanum commersonii TaxID=4109 RepID=A0A9J5XHC1_SOLCO|nr:hypothetical protein H5410_046770 [Solanum commersonii]
MWKQMLQARDDMDQEIWWEIRNGHSSIWYDNWTQLGSLNYWLLISHGIDENFEKVKQFKEDDGWNYSLIDNMCTEHVSHQVLNEIFRQRKDKKENIICNDNCQETFQHPFMQCPISKDLWSLFAGAAGVQSPLVQIKQTLDKWWKSDLKRKNIISHEGRMSKNAMISLVSIATG